MVRCIYSRQKAGMNDFSSCLVCDCNIGRGILAVNAELHSDLEQMLLENGSNQKYLYGINIYYDNGELDCCIDELQDYLMGENLYHTTEEQLVRYYDAFL